MEQPVMNGAGNGGSLDKCRRRWDLADADHLKYKFMQVTAISCNAVCFAMWQLLVVKRCSCLTACKNGSRVNELFCSSVCRDEVGSGQFRSGRVGQGYTFLRWVTVVVECLISVQSCDAKYYIR